MDTLKKRYLYKLAVNVLGMGIGAATQAIVPRGLGPDAYGDFNFLTNFFTQVTAFTDQGTSTGFYTKLSQKPKEFGLVVFYGCFALTVSGMILAGTGALLGTRFAAVLWPGQTARFVGMAAVLAVAMWLVQILNKMTDAHALTVSSEAARMVQKVLGLALIALLFWFNRLDMTAFFLYQYVLWIFLGAALIWILDRYGLWGPDWRLPYEQARKYAVEFYHYNHPLAIHALAKLLTGIPGRWMLQVFAGSVQQGFYGLSYQIGAMCFVCTSAMTPLLMREFTIAYDRNDLKEMAVLFRKHIPLLYSVAAYFSCFMALQADNVIYIMGGERFHAAGTTVAIMAFYPIHQTYGQLSGSVFYACGQTKLYRNIGVSFLIVGLVLAFVLLAPSPYGLGSGAVGLALGTVLTQFAAVNVQLYYNAKFLKLSFLKYFAHQILSLLAFLGLAWAATFMATGISGFGMPSVPGFLLAGACYTILVAALGFFVPAVFGLDRNRIDSLVGELRRTGD